VKRGIAPWTNSPRQRTR